MNQRSPFLLPPLQFGSLWQSVLPSMDEKEENRRHTKLMRLNHVLFMMSQKEIREAREAYFVSHPDVKEEYDKMVVTTGTGAAGVRNKSKVGPDICRHKLYGCIGGGDKTTHKTERCKFCTFHGKSTEYIREVRDAYFVKHHNTKVEYY